MTLKVTIWWAWLFTPVILAFESLRQEDHRGFKANLGYILNPSTVWETKIKTKLNFKKKTK